MRGKPSNIRPYSKFITNFKSTLKMSIYRLKNPELKLWYPGAWGDFLLWEFRTALINSRGYRECAVENIVKTYQLSDTVYHRYYTERGVVVPKNWIEESIVALEAAEWLCTNNRKDSELRLKPFRKLERYFLKLDDLEKAYDPYAINGANSNATLLRRIESIERQISAIGDLVGLPKNHN